MFSAEGELTVVGWKDFGEKGLLLADWRIIWAVMTFKRRKSDFECENCK